MQRTIDDLRAERSQLAAELADQLDSSVIQITAPFNVRDQIIANKAHRISVLDQQIADRESAE